MFMFIYINSNFVGLLWMSEDQVLLASVSKRTLERAQTGMQNRSKDEEVNLDIKISINRTFNLVYLPLPPSSSPP